MSENSVDAVDAVGAVGTVGDRTGGRHIGRRMTVQGWFQVVLALVMLMVVGGSVVGARLLEETTQVTDRLTDRLQPAQTEAYRLQASLVNQETGARGYVLAGDRQFLDPYTEGRKDEVRAATRLRELIGDQPRLLADLEELERQAEQWRRTYAEPLVAGLTSGESGAAADRAAAERGKAAFDAIRREWGTQNTHLAEAVADGKRDLSESRTSRNAILVAMVVAFLLAGLVLALIIRVLVARPLRSLSDSSRRVSGGEFDHVIAGEGPADLVAVAGAVEGMRRRIVAELDASHQQQDILARQTADLDAQAVELRRSNAELEQFAYVASHDLQEPLRKVASFCQLLEKRYSDKVDDRGRQYIDFAVDGAKRMQILINDLLTFSRVGRLNDARVDVDLDQVLTKALANLDTAVTESGARVERPERLPAVVGDPVLLGMVWQNLVGNAVKFRHPDRAPEIRITCEEDPDTPGTWLLSVTDNGIGIPEEFAEKVFVIFQRLHGRDAYGGTGIGLALCKKIVEHHGGHIRIDTGHTDGTRICFTLPSGGTQPSGDATAEGTDTRADARPDARTDSGTESGTGSGTEPRTGSRTDEKALT